MEMSCLIIVQFCTTMIRHDVAHGCSRPQMQNFQVLLTDQGMRLRMFCSWTMFCSCEYKQDSLVSCGQRNPDPPCSQNGAEAMIAWIKPSGAHVLSPVCLCSSCLCRSIRWAVLFGLSSVATHGVSYKPPRAQSQGQNSSFGRVRWTRSIFHPHRWGGEFKFWREQSEHSPMSEMT